MPTGASDDDGSEHEGARTGAPNGQPAQNAQDAEAARSARSRPPIERSRFGGTQRRHERRADDAPVSRSDLSKGPEELLEHRTARINWRVLVTSSGVILAFSIWAILAPADARSSTLGGGPAHQPEDHGFMYDWSFYDPDGHGWGVFWMDPAAVQD